MLFYSFSFNHAVLSNKVVIKWQYKIFFKLYNNSGVNHLLYMHTMQSDAPINNANQWWPKCTKLTDECQVCIVNENLRDKKASAVLICNNSSFFVFSISLAIKFAQSRTSVTNVTSLPGTLQCLISKFDFVFYRFNVFLRTISI